MARFHTYDAVIVGAGGAGLRAAREAGKRSQVHGIGCYSSLSHNHFDLRMQNEHLTGAAFWWWPERDRYGRDLDESHRPCWGEVKHAPSASGATTSSSYDIVANAQELERWEKAGEPADLHGLD